MNKMLLSIFGAALLLWACEDYGTKVRINHKSEVFYKNDATEAEAKKLGNFLLKQGYFTTVDTRSVQLLKEDEIYTVKFVVEEEKLKKDRENVLLGFKVWQMWIQDGVFGGAKTKVVLANNKLEVLQAVSEFTEQEKLEISSPGTASEITTGDR